MEYGVNPNNGCIVPLVPFIVLNLYFSLFYYGKLQTDRNITMNSHVPTFNNFQYSANFLSFVPCLFAREF